MTQHTLFVCILCRFSETEREHDGLSGGQHLLNSLSQGLEVQGADHSWQIHPVRCMGACSRACVVALTATNKLTFVFSDLLPLQSAPELLQFSQQYFAHPAGAPPYQERPELIRKKLLVVLPQGSASL